MTSGRAAAVAVVAAMLALPLLLAPRAAGAQVTIASEDGTEVTLAAYMRLRGSRHEDFDLDRTVDVDEAQTFYDARMHATLGVRRGGLGAQASLDLAGTDVDDGVLLGNENPAFNRAWSTGLRYMWVEYFGAVNARLGRQPARLGQGIVTHIARDAFRIWRAQGPWTFNATLVKGAESAVNAPTGEDDDLDALALFVQRVVDGSTLRAEWARQFDSSPADRFPEKQYFDVNAAGVLPGDVEYRAEVALQRGRTPAAAGQALDYEASMVFLEAHLVQTSVQPGIRLGRGSGDDDPTDGVQGDFASLFLDETHPAYTSIYADEIQGWTGVASSLAGGAGFANTTFVQPRLRVRRVERLSVDLSATLLRTTEGRTVGTGPLGNRPATGTASSNDLGIELDVDVVYDLEDGAQAGLSLGWFRPGEVYGDTAPEALKGEVWVSLGF